MQEHISLAPYTIYKIGGPARYFMEVHTVKELCDALQFTREKHVPFFVFGGGSNMLIADRGFDGLAIRITGGEVRVEGERVIADAGVMMARVVATCVNARLTGFEWGIGVPGTIGGSVRGNAGCFGGEMKDVIESVNIFDALNTKRFTLNADRCNFAYRDSVFKRHPEWVIVSATLHLRQGDKGAIANRIAEVTKERTAKQDIGTKSCGCIFKNVSWNFCGESKDAICARNPELVPFKNSAHIPASLLLDKAGMKGRAAGRVRISHAHANFFINEGGASAQEVHALIAYAKETVFNAFGIRLEEEIEYIGF